MSAITIAMLVEAVTGITTIVTHASNLINQMPSRRRVREEDIEPLRAQIDELTRAQDELKNNLSALANTLDAYIRAYFDLMSITTDCELLQMYVKENETDLTKKSAANRVWSNVFWMFKNIEREARNKYKIGNINQSGLVDPQDLTEIAIYVRDFETASNQAKVYIDNEWPDKLHDHVEMMADASQEISNVLHRQINRILSQSGDL